MKTLYINKNNWNTLSGKESKKIAQLLGVNEARILRIGNDTSDENEMSHMDGIFIESKILDTSINVHDSDFHLCETPDGKKFVREIIEDIIAYYIINDEGTNFKILSKEEVNHMEWIYRRLVAKHGEAENVDYMIKFREIFGFRELLTKEDLERMEPGTIITKGVIENSDKEDGLFMVNSNIGKKLLWVAKRGHAPDWAIYVHWEENGLDYVLKSGDKVSKYNVQKLVPCTEEALNMYRK